MSDRLLADGFEDAIVGVGRQGPSQELTIYDYDKCVDILKGQGITDEEAREYFDFNVQGSWVGPGTPIFLMPDRYYEPCD